MRSYLQYPSFPAASPVLGTTAMASQLLSLPSSLSFCHSYSVAGVSISSPPTSSLCVSATTSPALPLIYCGRGDKKTAKGKRFRHSFGNARPRDKKKGRGPPKAPAPPAPKKDPFDLPFDSDEDIENDISDE